MGYYSSLDYLSEDLKDMYLKTEDKQSAKFWNSFETYNFIFDKLKFPNPSLSVIFKAFDGHKIFEYMDAEMITFFNDLAEAIDWSNTTKTTQDVVFFDEKPNNYHFLKFNSGGSLLEHIYQSPNRSGDFIINHLNNTNSLMWLPLRVYGLRDQMTNKTTGTPFIIFE